MELFLKVLTTCVGVFGFDLIFGIEKKYWLLTSLLGGLDYLIYYLVYAYNANVFYASFIATVIIEIIIYIASKILKAPRIIFSTAIIIALVPGGLLYYTMRYLILSDPLLKQTATELLLTTLGLATGRSIVHAGFKFIDSIKKKKTN